MNAQHLGNITFDLKIDIIEKNTKTSNKKKKRMCRFPSLGPEALLSNALGIAIIITSL